MTVAVISTLPSMGTVVAAGKSVITVPVGASSGTLSHEEAKKMVPAAPRRHEGRGARGALVVLALEALKIILS